MLMSWNRFKHWFGGTVPVSAHYSIGIWPFIWLKPKVYRMRFVKETHWPLGPLRFIWEGERDVRS